MDLESLSDSLKEFFRKGSSAFYTAPGQSYGPAQSRWSQTPIRYSPNVPDPGLAGITDTNQFGHSKITMYPNSDEFRTNYGGNQSDIVRHESAHAILDSMPDSDAQLASMTSKNPSFNPVQQQLTAQQRFGNMTSEAPAYAVEKGMSQRYGVPEQQRQQFLENMHAQLSTVDPKRAAMYARLAGINPNAQTTASIKPGATQ